MIWMYTKEWRGKVQQKQWLLYVTMRNLTRRVERVGHKFYMDNFISSPYTSDDLYTRGISCCGTVKYCKGMARGLDKKTTKIETERHVLRWNVTWQQWFGKMSEMCTFWQTCINHQQKAIFVTNRRKLVVTYVGYIDREDRMANSYSVSWRTLLWTKASHCSQIDFRKLCLVLVQNLFEMNLREPHPQPTSKQRSNPQTSQMTQLEGWQFKHRAVAGLWLWCHMCTDRQKCSTTKCHCERCKVVLCLHPCFRIQYTKVHFWNMGLLHHGKQTTSRNLSAVWWE
jgi:hypothetical protein